MSGLKAPTWVDNSWSSIGGSGANVATQSADNTSGTDGWSGFFKNATSTLFNYALQKDAARTGFQLQQQVQPQPVYITQPAASGSAGVPPLVMVGGLALVAVLAFVALKK